MHQHKKVVTVVWGRTPCKPDFSPFKKRGPSAAGVEPLGEPLDEPLHVRVF